MSHSRATQVVLICEDKRHEQFCRRFLIARGVSPGKIRAKIAPTGQGDAKQWVRELYPLELRAYRAKANHINNSLIVMTDLDHETLQQRRQALLAACQAAGVDDARIGERILLALPKWAIETWILALVGESLAEKDRIHPSHKQRGAIHSREAAQLLAVRCASAQPPNGIAGLPSLQDACSQFGNLSAAL